MTTDLEIQELLRLMQRASAGDMSILLHASRPRDEPVSMATSPGTNNDKLWSEMVKLGWMSVRDDKVPTKFAAITIRIFTLTPNGRAGIAELLTRSSKREGSAGP